MKLVGSRWELRPEHSRFPQALRSIDNPPACLYGIGSIDALQEGLAVVGARKATPYGRGCARRFAGMAAERGVIIISGGARGCDAEAHRAALAAKVPTVVILGGGCDELYPACHGQLFQEVIDRGGAVIAEHEWSERPRPYMFRLRNRLIAGLSKAVLIVEAGLPSGTFSTADEALASNKDVLVVPGAITSATSLGTNRLLYQGAMPIVDDDTFCDALFSLFGCLHAEDVSMPKNTLATNPLTQALLCESLGMEQLYGIARECCGGEEPHSWLMERLVQAEKAGLIARYPDGRWGPQP